MNSHKSTSCNRLFSRLLKQKKVKYEHTRNCLISLTGLWTLHGQIMSDMVLLPEGIILLYNIPKVGKPDEWNRFKSHTLGWWMFKRRQPYGLASWQMSLWWEHKQEQEFITCDRKSERDCGPTIPPLWGHTSKWVNHLHQACLFKVTPSLWRRLPPIQALVHNSYPHMADVKIRQIINKYSRK